MIWSASILRELLVLTSNPRVTLREVSLRDGLQSIPVVIPTDVKLHWLSSAYAAGLREMEVGSFVPARLLPQLADTAQVIAAARQYPDLVISALVPNLKGAQFALDAGVDIMIMPLSASHQHSLANLRKTPDDVVAEVAAIRAARDASGSRTKIEGGIGTAFGCTLQGAVAHHEVVRLAQALLDAGADYISLADTVGYADPASVARLFEQVRAKVGDNVRAAHFHDTRGLALANTVTALQAGVRRFDSCLAGIGGCPHAPGASGNVATEDLAFMLESMGYDTGTDISRLLATRLLMQQALQGQPLHGALWRAGLPKTFAANAA